MNFKFKIGKTQIDQLGRVLSQLNESYSQSEEITLFPSVEFLTFRFEKMLQ